MISLLRVLLLGGHVRPLSSSSSSLEDTLTCTATSAAPRVQGVVGILVTAPYYGARRPAGQEAWFLQQVSDAFAQAWAVALEATVLLHWARRSWDVPLAITGVSYGAAMAALTSKLYPGPLAVVPFMGCSGPGEPFAHGASAATPRPAPSA